MTRWEPNARGRLEQAAFALYSERGFDNTTVAEIAERAGLTERTFFRHFADKREVLFAGATALEDAFVSAVAEAPESLSPLDAAAAGLEVLPDLLPEPDIARRRQAIIASNPELQERELIKLAALSAALADTLRRRGASDPAAGLTADITIAVFKTAFERWIAESNRRDLRELIHQALAEVKALSAEPGPASVASAQA